jgi:hypothetical protein
LKNPFKPLIERTRSTMRKFNAWLDKPVDVKGALDFAGRTVVAAASGFPPMFCAETFRPNDRFPLVDKMLGPDFRRVSRPEADKPEHPRARPLNPPGF